jgi:hypothetical protein
MYEAAQDSGQRPEDLSFVHAVRVLNRRLPEAAAVPPFYEQEVVKAFHPSARAP